MTAGYRKAAPVRPVPLVVRIFPFLSWIKTVTRGINFVFHSVIVGFTAGAAFLIATSQLKHALGIPIPGGASFLTS